MPAAAAAVAGLTCPAGSRGWCAAVAGILEATAAKPGNVHPAASFADLTHADLVAAAVAIAPVLERATTAPPRPHDPRSRVGGPIRADTNASLGIILLTAPLAAVPDGEPLSAAAVDQVLARLDAGDAADVYRAGSRWRGQGAWAGSTETTSRGRRRPISAQPCGPPPTATRSPRLWAEGFGPLFAGAVADLSTTVDAGMPLLDAIVECHLPQLAREPDSLIARKHGAAAAAKVSAAAAAILRLSATERPAARPPSTPRSARRSDSIPAPPPTSSQRPSIFCCGQDASPRPQPLFPSHPAHTMTERFEVQLRKAVHVFAAGHFITLTDDLCEPVHGHNWTVGVDVAGEPDAHGMVVDFIALRDAVTTVLARLDHKMLLPTANPWLAVTTARGRTVATRPPSRSAAGGGGCSCRRVRAPSTCQHDGRVDRPLDRPERRGVACDLRARRAPRAPRVGRRVPRPVGRLERR